GGVAAGPHAQPQRGQVRQVRRAEQRRQRVAVGQVDVEALHPRQFGTRGETVRIEGRRRRGGVARALQEELADRCRPEQGGGVGGGAAGGEAHLLHGAPAGPRVGGPPAPPPRPPPGPRPPPAPPPPPPSPP